MIDLDVISSPVYHDLLTLIDSFATAANGKKRSSSSGGAGGAGGDSLAAIKKRKAV
jgi:hypothetical protein